MPIKNPQRPYSTVLYSNNGSLLGAKIASDEQWRFPELDSVPYKFKQSLIYFEDQYFYKHPGVNPLSLLRALKQNLKAGKVVSGGSTITMQLIRILYDNPNRTVWQKSKETVKALKLELKYSKEEILKKYASNAPFGGNIVGLEAAAWRYYGRNPDQLSWAESVTLAILPNAPSLIRPGKNMPDLLRKRNFILHKLLINNIIDSTEYELALMENLPQKPHNLPRIAPHLLDRLALSNREEKVHSCIDYQLQKKVNRAVKRHYKILSKNEIHNLAAIVIKIETGEVLAYVGNTNIENAENHGNSVDIITAPRSSGSILKPFLYAYMLDNGEILPESLVPDIPTQMKGYSPKNYNLDYDGAVPASKALARSLNVPSVHMLHEFGIGRFLDYLKKMDFRYINESSEHYGLSLILGGAEVSLWDLAGSYASFGRILNHYNYNSSMYNKNDFHEPIVLKSDLQRFNPKGFTENKQLVSASSIWLTLEALLKVNRPNNELGWESFSSSHKIAWKTGTSFGFRDAWAVGLNKEYLVGVWAGNADGEGRPGLIGTVAAAPVMFELFDLLPYSDWYDKPYDDLIKVPVCRESGFRASHLCENIDSVYIPEAGLKTKACPFHHLIHLSKDRMYQVSSNCEKPTNIIHESWFILPPAWEWYYKRKNPLYKTLPPYKAGCDEKNEISIMEFVYPLNASNIYIPRDLDGKLQMVVFEVAHRYPNKKIYWHLDDQYIGLTKEFHQMQFYANEGKHTLTVVDEDGNMIKKQINLVGSKTVKYSKN
ncbi:MAG: penicillin-binding protein 1C [Bacteroidales bacterium]